MALLVAAARLKENGEARVLMLAPTKPLAEQHYRFFRDFLILPDDDAFVLFTGETPPAERVRGWERSRICFATPQVIKNDCLAGRYSLEDVALLVVDECHRAVGNYAYTFSIGHRFTNMSALLMSAAVIVFLIGLISEQITNLTYKRDG